MRFIILILQVFDYIVGAFEKSGQKKSAFFSFERLRTSKKEKTM